MSPVMLLHEPNPPFETRRLVGVLADRIGDAEAACLWPHRVLPIAATLLRRAGGPRVVHAFGRRALALAALAARADVLFSPTQFPRDDDIAWLRAAMRYRSIRVVSASDAERRAWVTGGVAIEQCVLIRPGVSMAAAPDARAAARARFGYGDDQHVVFSPLPTMGQARSVAVWTGCLLNILDPKWRLLGWTPDGQKSVGTLESLRSRLVTPDSFRFMTDESPAAGFAVADAILLPPDEVVPPTIIAMAMASGRPIVAYASASVCEMIEDRHTAMLAGKRTPRALAERVFDLFADADTAHKIGDRARAEAYEFFLLSRLIADYRTLYTTKHVAAAS